MRIFLKKSLSTHMYPYRKCRMYVSSDYQLSYLDLSNVELVMFISLLLFSELSMKLKSVLKEILTHEYRYIPLVIAYRIQELITFKNDTTPC